ncbi:hypothetical protein niasHT_029726 [Heterodera trifolii]|uniref:Glutathione synthetase n=1 Tax=Heterodera trifolii TaxID=157864 RepID=A0ABD2KRC9_9BILA
MTLTYITLKKHPNWRKAKRMNYSEDNLDADTKKKIESLLDERFSAVKIVLCRKEVIDAIKMAAKKLFERGFLLPHDIEKYFRHLKLEKREGKKGKVCSPEETCMQVGCANNANNGSSSAHSTCFLLCSILAILLLYFHASQDFAFFKEMHRQLVERNEVFTKPGMVERFFPDPNEAHIVEAIRKVQAKSWALGDDENEANEIKKKVYENPQNYVLKTNECGTPNQRLFFNDDIPKKLARMTPAEHNYFYIMEKLRPMVVKNQFVRPKIGFTANLDVTPELGIYGCLIGNMVTGEVSYVSRFGHTMKTKTADEDEGGIMRGNSVADTPYLV